MFVPAVVLLVPLYLTVLRPAVHRTSTLGQLRAGAPCSRPAPVPSTSALVKRFFDNLPREVLDAAQVDGAGTFRLFWYVVLPMSRPVLGVVSVFAVLAALEGLHLAARWCSPTRPSSRCRCAYPRLAGVTELDVFLAALLISCSLPIVFFLVFQRFFLRGGLEGAVKG